MKYDGVVIKIIKKLFLFLLDPDSNKIKDGINISDHECYKDLKPDQMMIVNVTFKDGTLNIEKVDLDEFIHGDTYGEHDTFLYIHDVMMFTINKEDDNITIEDIIKKGDLNDVAIDCINSSKKQLEEHA